MKDFASAIYIAVLTGHLAQPFNADMAHRAVPGWADATYHVFFPKHRVGNPGHNTELFIRVAPGRYEIIPSKARDVSQDHKSP